MPLLWQTLSLTIARYVYGQFSLIQTCKGCHPFAEFEGMITVCFELKLLRYILLIKQEVERSTQIDNLLSSVILFHVACEIAHVVQCL